MTTRNQTVVYLKVGQLSNYKKNNRLKVKKQGRKEKKRKKWYGILYDISLGIIADKAFGTNQ